MQLFQHNSARRALWALASTLLLASLASAQSRVYREGSGWVEETTGDLPGSRSLKVHTEIGAVSVQGGASSSVHYVVRKRVNAGSEEEARRMFEAFRFMATSRGEMSIISGEGGWRRGSLQILLSTPKQLDFARVNTEDGDVNIASISGRAEIETGAGKVSVDGVGGAVRVSSGGGNIHVGDVGSTLEVRSGGGRVDIGTVGSNALVETGGSDVIVNAVKGDLKVETGGGNIAVKNVGGGLRASTGGGNLDLGNVGGMVAAETGGGSIRVTAGGNVSAQTGAGTIQCYNIRHGLRAVTDAGGITAQFIGTKADFSDSKLEAGMGDIVVYLPSNLGVNIVASIDLANGHGIRSEFPGLKISQENGGFGPGEAVAEGSINGGGPTLKLHTTSGSISLRRLQKLVGDREDLLGKND